MIDTMLRMAEREIAWTDAATGGEDPDVRRRAEAEGLRARQQRLRYIVLTALPAEMAGVLAVFAQLERRLIGERTRLALARPTLRRRGNAPPQAASCTSWPGA